MSRNNVCRRSRWWLPLSIALLAGMGSGISRGQSLVVDVLLKDTEGLPVQSTITKVVDISTKGAFIAITLRDGKRRIPCDATDLIRAEPIGSVYRWSDPQPCASPATFVVPFKPETIQFISAANLYRQHGDAAKAAILYNDLAFRFQYVDSGKSEEFTRLTFEQAAKTLNVAMPTVKDTGRTVMSPQLQEAVKQVQGAAKIKQNGILNLPTLVVLANQEDGKNPNAVLSLKEIVAAAPKQEVNPKQ